MTDGQPGLVIAGGGLAGCIAALALAKRRPDVPFLLLEQADTFGGNHVWSFFDSDVGEHRDLIAPLITRHWPDHEIRFPARRRQLGIGYNSIRSANLDRHVRQALAPDRYRLNASVGQVGIDHVVLDSGERIAASAVIDCRGPDRSPGLELAWQKFVGRTYRFDAPHGVERPIIMDATVDQSDGYRFIYSLPFSPTELMVEDTYYSTSPVLDAEPLGKALDGLAPGGRCIGEETGMLPVLLGGALEDLWPEEGEPVPRLGLRGGFFHPTTGYSLPDAVRNADLLSGQTDFSPQALHNLFRNRAAALWKERHFFQLLNRMLFGAANPAERYRVLEHFYRLPEPVIGRFYAARLTAFDKLRIVSGRPPVPIGRALAALRRSAA